MPLKEEMENQGLWLFRWRSYLPALMLPVLAWALRDARLSTQVPSAWDLVCVGVSFFGLFLRGLVAGFVPGGTSGRNVARQEAAHLNQTGIYSLMRHPLYVGNFFMALGPVMFIRVPWFILVFALLYALYYERIMFAEEEFLRKKYKGAYEKWASRTSAIFPFGGRWVPPSLPFSLKTFLRREYPGFLGLALAFNGLVFLRYFVSGKDHPIHQGWFLFLGAGLVLYLFLRTIKHHTRWLSIPGR